MLKTKTKKIITICASAAHYQQVLEVERQLKQLDYAVKVPKTARRMQREGDFTPDRYKTWYGNHADYHKKTELMKAHFKKVMEADAILVTNYEKRGLPGYIGGNVLMEMTLAFIQKKPIFILNPISDELGIAEEIYGMQPIFLGGDVTTIKRKMR